MSIFGNIIDKIFHHEKAQAPATPAPAPAAPTGSAAPAPSPLAPPAPQAGAQPAAPAEQQTPVDVGAVLETMAGMKADGGGHYRTSIVDLLKLLDLDSSLTAREALADELGVKAGEAGSAEQNLALHRAVMDKLAQNGGVVPDSLRQ